MYMSITKNIKSTALLETQEYMLDMGITGFKTPAESPDMNPIEKVWKEIKDEV